MVRESFLGKERVELKSGRCVVIVLWMNRETTRPVLWRGSESMRETQEVGTKWQEETRCIPENEK